MRAAFVALLLLAGCAEPPEVPNQRATPDLCGASGLQGLIGQPGDVVARMTLPKGTRVIAADSAITSDLRRERLNIELDAKGRVQRIACF